MVYGMIVSHRSVSRNAFVSRLCETGHRGCVSPFTTHSSRLICTEHIAKAAVCGKVALLFCADR